MELNNNKEYNLEYHKDGDAIGKKGKKRKKKQYSHKKIGNKKYPVKAIDGSTIYVSMNHAKKIRQTNYRASKLNYHLNVLPNFTFALIDEEDNYIVGNPQKGLELYEIRKKIKKLRTKRGKGKQQLKLSKGGGNQ